MWVGRARVAEQCRRRNDDHQPAGRGEQPVSSVRRGQRGRLVQDLVFDRLAEIDDDLHTVGDKSFTPRLAEKWTWAPDSLSIAFSINPRARWHDGLPVTAADVRYSVKTFLDPKVASSAASAMQNIDSVSVRDSLTAVVWFKRHTPEQFYDLAYQVLVFPEHVYGKILPESLRTSDAATHPIGSGRFRFGKWERGVRLELLADTANYRGRPKLDRVVVVRTDPAASIAQVLGGQVDMMEQYPADQYAKLDSNTNARPIVVPQQSYAFFGMNLHTRKSKTVPHPIFSDVRVRRALSMAVNREAMLANVFGGMGRLSHGPFVKFEPYADTTLKLLPYDTTAAKALLDSAGWRAGADGIRAKSGKPLRFSALVLTSSTQRTRYAVLIQEQLRKLGVQMDLDQVDFNTFRPRYQSSDFEAVMGGVSADPSPTGVKQVWGSAGVGEQNVLGYSNTRVDALLDSAALAFDAVKSKHYTSSAFQQIIDDAPAVWLYDLVAVDAVNRRFTVQPMRADGWWSKLDEWSIPSDKRIDRDRIGLTPSKP